MKQKAIEPGLLRVFRYFTVIAVIYFAFIAAYAIISTGEIFSPPQIGTYLNLAVFFLLALYLSWDWLRRKLKAFYLPLALAIATLYPIVNMLLFFPGQQQNDLISVIIASWSLFPILLIPLVLTAWQYGFKMVLVFTGFTAIFGIAVVWNAVGVINLETLPILGIPFIQAFAFGIVGHIVTRLMASQKEQRRKLVQANIKLAEYAKTQEQLAISRERNRLARELHDTLAHTLSGLTVNLEAIKLTIPEDPQEAQYLIDEALNNTRFGLAETRRALKALRPQRLEDLGLGMAIMNLAEDAARRADAELDMDIDVTLPDFPPDVEQGIYRLTQESLQNIVKHAEAQHISVRLKCNKRKLILEVHDDGKGINESTIEGNDSMGVKLMRERAELIGGELEISSVPDKGTLVQFTLELSYGPNFNM